MNTGNNIDGATNDTSDSINPANANANASDETDALHLEALALGDHIYSGSITSALRGSLHAIKSDEPGRYGRDGYLSGVDNMTLYMLCSMILSYSGIVEVMMIYELLLRNGAPTEQMQSRGMDIYHIGIRVL